jgi:hypothetical protein
VWDRHDSRGAPAFGHCGVVVSAVALAIPPIAVIIANAGDEASRRR